MYELSVPTRTHGRVLVEDAADVLRGMLVGFHGYGQAAEDMLDQLRRLPGASGWTLVSVQGLHRFYTRDHERVIASWMTRQDRDDAIADNVAYVDRVVEAVARKTPGVPEKTPGVFFVGFSQGVAMAYRAALLGRVEPAGVIALAGDIPPELRAPAAAARPWPPVLLATGTRDTWYTPARLADDAAFLASAGVPHEAVTFDGGHEWTGRFGAVVSRWLQARL